MSRKLLAYLPVLSLIFCLCSVRAFAGDTCSSTSPTSKTTVANADAHTGCARSAETEKTSEVTLKGGRGGSSDASVHPNNTGCTGNAFGLTGFSTLFTFSALSTGETPKAGLVQDNQCNLYGTTRAGGVGCTGANCRGTVYKISPGSPGTGTETLLHSFINNSGDGNYPTAPLVFDVSGNLWGQTSNTGGANSAGVLFELTPSGSSWTYTKYSFPGGATGPFGGTIGLTVNSSGVVYGAGLGGDPSELWSFNPGTQAFTDLYDSGYAFDGGTLAMDASGNFYGALSLGPNSYGEIWQLTSSAGTYTYNDLYDFQNSGGTGYSPIVNPIIDPSGNLYGTTQSGGAQGEGEGSIYELKKGTGNIELIYEPCGGNSSSQNWPTCPDGAYPYSLTMDSAGNLYGVMEFGGDQSNSTGNSPACQGQQFGGNNGGAGGAGGCGVLFELSPTNGTCPANTTAGPTNNGVTWCETVLHTFEENTDGASPTWVMLGTDNNLYGVTTIGTSGGTLLGTVWGYPLPQTTPSYTLTVSEQGTGTGTVTSSPTGISCPGTCSASFNSGTAVTLTETPGGSSTFGGWSGGGCAGTSNTCNITLTSDASVTATFNGQLATSTTLSSSANPSTYGQNVTFTATVGASSGTPTGSVTFYNGMTALGTEALNSGQAQYSTSSLAPGSYSITADYLGSSNYLVSASSTLSQTVNPASNAVTFTTPAPSSAEYGSSFTVAASGLGTGAITYTSDGVVCTNLGATYTMTAGSGTCTVTATQAADSNYASANSSESVTAQPAVGSVSVSLTSGTNPSIYGQSITFTATITSDTGAVKGRKTTKRPRDLNGSVSWSANTGCSTSTVSGNPPQTATCTTTTLQAGTDTVTATYTASDSNHMTASGSVSQTVNGDANTVTFTTPAPSSAVYNTSFTVAATGLGTGAITYTSGGSCTNSGPSYTMTSGTGTCTVSATQAADSTYQSASASGTTHATKASQMITVTTAQPSSAIDGSSFTMVASASSGLPVTYTSGGSCTNTNGTYTMTTGSRIGSVCTEDIFQTGNSNYNAAVEVTEQTTVAAPTVPTVTFTGPTPSSAVYGTTFTAIASSSDDTSVPVISTSTPTICSVTGSTTSGTTVTATVQMLVGAGSCKLAANWGITTVYKAHSKALTVATKKATPTVSFTGAPTTANDGDMFPVTATSNSTATPTITSTTAAVCSVGAVTSNGAGGYQATVTMIKATGTCHTKAAFAATTDFAAASATQSTAAE